MGALRERPRTALSELWVGELWLLRFNAVVQDDRLGLRTSSQRGNGGSARVYTFVGNHEGLMPKDGTEAPKRLPSHNA